jgi:uncharacterized membrane protein YkvA (DUF1232 family)
MQTSFLASVISKYYPATADKINILIESNVLLEKLAKRVYKKLETSVQKYADVMQRLKILLRMLDAWRTKDYTDISYTAIFLCIAILLYFINPIDLFPDFIPVVGGLDDVILLSFLFKIIDKELEKFLIWEKENSTQTAKA